MSHIVFRHSVVAYLWVYLCLAVEMLAMTPQEQVSIDINRHDQTFPSEASPHTSNGLLSISSEWSVLGPFKIGTREAVWGADPLEAHGGFSVISPESNHSVPSALGRQGRVAWSSHHAEVAASKDRLRSNLDVSFPGIDWAFLQSVYGWAALQYQAWARGFLRVHGRIPVNLQIFTDGLLELRIDGKSHFGGDFYSYRRAPLFLTLYPGENIIELRLIRDVRKDGALVAPPVASGVFEVALIRPRLFVDGSSLIVPEVVDGRLAGSFASIIVHNPTVEWFRLTGISVAGAGESNVSFSLTEKSLDLAPNQSRPVVFKIRQSGYIKKCRLMLQYKSVPTDNPKYTKPIAITFVSKTSTEAHKFTFQTPTGIVSYAILRAPNCPGCLSKSQLPVLVGLHGAGLDAGSGTARHMLDAAYGACAWIILPTGGSSWSSDDWHVWGSEDVKAAVKAIPQWIHDTNWTGPGVLLDDWIVVGHSNGGQGVWYLLTHEPDKIVAAAPVSGYSSIENYVPFTMWREADSALSAVFRTARQNYRHELLLENFRGIPVLQQHGSADHNVPAYHSRLMHELAGPGETMYWELNGEPHWRDGVLTTSHLLKFYERHTANPVHLIPREFSIIIPPAGTVGARAGIIVDQLTSAHESGRADVVRKNSMEWEIKTQNIRGFYIKRSSSIQTLNRVLVDSHMCDLSTLKTQQISDPVYFSKTNKSWTVASSRNASSAEQRFGRQTGSMDAILRSNGRFKVVSWNADMTDGVAVQVSRNLLQYFGADSEIADDLGEDCEVRGNIITVAGGHNWPPCLRDDYPIRMTHHDTIITVEGEDEESSATYEVRPGLFTITLRPVHNERLELLIWGGDQKAMIWASRLVPTLTGVGQPDFIIGDMKKCRWLGAGGVLATGFFDWQWRISKGSYIVQ